MKFNDIAQVVEGVPYTQPERGRALYDHIIKHKPEKCLELGFAHGVASCYMAAALDEIGGGKLVCVDLEHSSELSPNIEGLLNKAGLAEYVTICREKNSYTWFLKNEIEKNTENYHCDPKYDLCFIDGSKNWTIDGCAFFLADKLLRENGYIVFDDYRWAYWHYPKKVMDGITVRDMSEEQINEPNIELVFQLLVMQHPDYSNFVIDEDWAWAQKIRSVNKSVQMIASQSFKYRLLKQFYKIKKSVDRG